MQVLRKLLQYQIEGNTETKVLERIEKEVLTDKEAQELINLFGDDGEDAYFRYGLAFDFNDDLYMISLDSLTEGLSVYLKDEKNQTIEDILKKVEPLRGYDLYFEG